MFEKACQKLEIFVITILILPKTVLFKTVPGLYCPYDENVNNMEDRLSLTHITSLSRSATYFGNMNDK